MKYLSFIIIIVSIISCTNKQTKSNNQNSENEQDAINRSIDIPEPDILERLAYNKTMLDSLISDDKVSVKSYYKELDKIELIEMPSDNLVEETDMQIETIYDVWRNLENKIFIVGEYPYSQSGDWSAGFIHYFDNQGLTFSSVNTITYFIEDGLATATQIDYYDNNFNRIDRQNTLTDNKGINLDKKEISNPYDFTFNVYTNSKALLKAKNIK